jgi:hypothetical protein
MILLGVVSAHANWTSYTEEVSPEELKSAERPAAINKLERIDERVEKALNAFDRLTIAFNIGDTIKFLDALNFGIRYRYRAEPADIGKYFARIDRWRVTGGIRPGDFFDNLRDSVLGFSMDAGVEVTFVQLYDKVSDARKIQNGYTPARLPITSKKAIELLNPGDLAVFDGIFSLLIGVGDSSVFFKDKLNFVFNVGGQLSGRFRIFVFRGHDNLVRLRIAGIRSKNQGFRFRLGVEEVFTPIGSTVIRSPLVNMLDADEIIQYGASLLDQDIYMSDYTIDLSDPDAARAYDSIFTGPRRLKEVVKIANPFRKDDEIRQTLVTNLSELNELARADLDKPKKRVTVNFRGANYTDGRQKFSEFNGLKLYGRSNNNFRRDNYLTDVVTTPTGDDVKRYFFPSWADNTRTTAFFSWFKKERDDQLANILYETNDKFEIQRFHSIGFYRDISDNIYNPHEHREILRNLKKTLTPHVYEELKTFLLSKNWYDLKKEKDNVRISSRYFLHENGLRLLEGLHRSSIESEIVNIIKRFDDANPYSKNALNRYNDNPTTPRCSDELLKRYGITNTLRPGGKMVQYCNAIAPLAERLESVLASNRSAGVRHQEVSELEKNELFRFLGPSLIFELLPESAQTNLSYFEIVIAARDLELPLIFKHGMLEDRNLFEKILEVERLLNDEDPDLRLNSDKESKTEKNVNQGWWAPN